MSEWTQTDRRIGMWSAISAATIGLIFGVGLIGSGIVGWAGCPGTTVLLAQSGLLFRIANNQVSVVLDNQPSSSITRSVRSPERMAWWIIDHKVAISLHDGVPNRAVGHMKGPRWRPICEISADPKALSHYRNYTH